MATRIIVAYTSWYGNCRKAAEYLGDALKTRGCAVELVSIRDSETPSGAADGVVLVTPVRMGRIPAPSRAFARTIKRFSPKVPFDLVVTHGAPLDHFFSPVKTTKRLLQRLRRRGFQVGDEPLYLRVTTEKGPLPGDYAARLDALAESIGG